MIQQALKATLKKIKKLETDYAKTANSVHLLAVSKTFPKEAVIEAYQAGQRDFGENYLQDALSKINAINYKDIIWHFIGHIQSNKTKEIAENFSWVHTVDREKIAQRLNQQRPSHLPPLKCCIQVNISNEAQKNGLKNLDEIKKLAHTIDLLPHLQFVGLMTIPKHYPTFAQQKNEFEKLTQLFTQLKNDFPTINCLSMGMTQDLDAAIAAGSTWVRIGTGIFGKR